MNNKQAKRFRKAIKEELVQRALDENNSVEEAMLDVKGIGSNWDAEAKQWVTSAFDRPVYNALKEEVPGLRYSFAGRVVYTKGPKLVYKQVKQKYKKAKSQ